MSVVGSRSNPEKFLGQDYHQLHRDFYDNRARFLDSTFLPNERAIGQGLLPDEEMDRVEWIRPTVDNSYHLSLLNPPSVFIKLGYIILH